MTRSAMTCRRSKTRMMVLVGLLALTLLDSVAGVPYRRSLLRLCSRSLSDALRLTCKDRGYNEPFSYSDEEDAQDSMDPGLAEECCYHECSYKQLEQYCRPVQELSSSTDAVDEPVWIVNLRPYLSEPPGMSSEERPRSDVDYVTGTVKCRIHGLKGSRKKGANTERDDDGGCDGKMAMKKHRGHCGCRHRRQRRRRLGKILEKTLADKWSRNEALSSAPVSSSKGSPFSWTTN